MVRRVKHRGNPRGFLRLSKSGGRRPERPGEPTLRWTGFRSGDIFAPPMPTQRPHSRVVDLDRVRAHTLPNGLRVRVLADAAAPTVSYYTFFQVGSRNEKLGTTGISHLF